MRIHVTGATGFVGRHVLEEARRRGHEVVALVRQRSDDLGDVEQIEIGDISQVADWTSAVVGADAVVHLAARVHVMHDDAPDLEREYARVNTDPTVKLAEAAVQSGVRRFVFMSSIKVNGERTTSQPYSSSSTPAPADPYGRSKHRAELALQELAEDSSLSVVALRPTVVYGPGVGGNIRRIAGAVRRGIPLPLGSVHNARTMLAVENLAVGTVNAAEIAFDGFRLAIVGDPAPVSTRRLVELLAAGMNEVPRLIPFPVGLLKIAGAAVGRRSDVSRLTEDLVVRPDWELLNVDAGQLTTTDEAMAALGRTFSTSTSGGVA